MAPVGKWREIREIGTDLWGSLSISVKINPEASREPIRYYLSTVTYDANTILIAEDFPIE